MSFGTNGKTSTLREILLLARVIILYRNIFFTFTKASEFFSKKMDLLESYIMYELIT